MPLDPALAPVFPRTAVVSPQGRLVIGGCDTVALAREFGTPLYLFDETELRENCREWLHEFRSRHPETAVVYAAKAYLGRALAQLIAEEGLGLDVASGGELAIALAAGFPAERIYFHGNNKSRREIEEAVEAGLGCVVVDNLHEAAMLNEIAVAAGRRQRALLRVSPNIDPHTHRYISTGALDSKFGVAIGTGQAEEAATELLAAPGIELLGFHVHIGSQIMELEPHAEACRELVRFAAAMKARHGFEARVLSAGGGFAIQYVRDTAPPSKAQYAEAVVSAVKEGCDEHGLPAPRLTVEPGRSIAGRAGVALYGVGARKEIPGVRTYVAVDGGMADNIRPALYQARYEAVVASRMNDAAEERVTVAGKYCESGDVLIRDIDLPKLWADDILAVPGAGAYCLPMASNYNAALKPPVLFVREGKARLVRRRETYEDVLRCET
ncbi:MAG: diaminopimelate decarboxylase [Dehalococcoidia bacterium]|nr:diaminopimelate decarboxylase [Dehalococcoidia bacterium]